jgi:adenylate cyclase class IV
MSTCEEIEVLYEIAATDFEKVLAALTAKAVPARSFTLDIYFSHSGLPSLHPKGQHSHLDHCLRIRRVGESWGDSVACGEFVFKKDEFDASGNWLMSDEAGEVTELSEKQCNALETTLKRMGFFELVRLDVEKYEADLDEFSFKVERVKGLGCFLEIELARPRGDMSIPDVHASIENAAVALGVLFRRRCTDGKLQMALQRRL